MSLKRILDQELLYVTPEKEEIEYLKKIYEQIISKLKTRIKKRKIKAEVFIGGSLAKNTLIKKSNYDVDIFVRFDKRYSEVEIAKHLRKIMFFFYIPGLRMKKKRIHGSRDYYKLILKNHKHLSMEIIPTLKISKVGEARNITDLSYFHVNYVEKKLTKKIRNSILLAKSFCHAQKCYGAESHIKGFSGYALELLMIYYKDFEKFLKELSSKEKIIIDPAKHYKSEKEILEKLSPAKTHSPVIIIDPTYKERNATGALSKETFAKFREKSKSFLKRPHEDFFKYKKIDLPYLKKTAIDLKGILGVFEIKTRKQSGDVAGTKMLKFSKVLNHEIKKHFDVIEKEYVYWGNKTSHMYYVLKRKDEIVTIGPSIHYTEAVKRFKKKHKIWYIEEGKIKSAKPTDLSLKEFLKDFKSMNKKKMKQMDITGIRVI